MEMGLDNALRFEDMMTNLFKDTSSVGIGLLYSNYISNETLETIRNAADTFIELKRGGTEELQGTVRVTNTSQKISTEWMSSIIKERVNDSTLEKVAAR